MYQTHSLNHPDRVTTIWKYVTALVATALVVAAAYAAVYATCWVCITLGWYAK